MKYVFALVLLCIATPLSAGDRCTKADANRAEIARTADVRPSTNRAEVPRARKVVTLTAWQRALFFDPQIL